MNFSIIRSFIDDQRLAKRIIADKLGVPVDITAMDWVIHRKELCNSYSADPFADIFRPHGFGLEFRMGDLYIDYDYSLTGRADGFDAWRI